ncbi:hypothetical protein FQA39_LY00688 [Lamprigera yunnana]|nr:hypothetical protein FQA39_LY00688 [Lamprigera yunnana]
MVREQVSYWDNLMELMKEQFRASLTEDILWKQILERTEGADESIGIDVAIMTNLFDRMPRHISKELRLKFCRKIEETKIKISEYKPPKTGQLSLEPDLDYHATVNEDNSQIVWIPDYDLSLVLNNALDSVSSIPNKPIDDADITAHVIVNGCMCINKTKREQSTIEYPEGDKTISNIDVTEYIIERVEDSENVEEATDSTNVDGNAENSVTYHGMRNGEHADKIIIPRRFLIKAQNFAHSRYRRINDDILFGWLIKSLLVRYLS